MNSTRSKSSLNGTLQSFGPAHLPSFVAPMDCLPSHLVTQSALVSNFNFTCYQSSVAQDSFEGAYSSPRKCDELFTVLTYLILLFLSEDGDVWADL